MNRISRTQKSVLLAGSALALVLAGSSGASAQNCVSTPLRGGFLQIGSLAAATASSVASSIGNVDTAFLTQQGSAFVANPGGAAPNQQGGGVWVRGVGGEVDIKSTSTTFANQTPVITPAIDSGTITCASKQHETFAGVQVGTDIARLNMDGWNVNVGTTAGYLASDSTERNGFPPFFKTSFEVPFAGGYVVATKGSFFADVMVRGEFYNMEINNPALNFFNQPFTAHGISVSASAGYNFQLGNSWFIEPSAGIIASRTKIDSFSVVGLPSPQLGSELSGTLSINDIDSDIGRATVRVGTTVTNGNFVLQPFGSASVFHEFAGNIRSNYISCANCVFVPPVAVTDTFATSTTRVGTYGQFSLGLAGQVVNTGWVGFVRGDYRTGENIQGWTANAGLRYNFVPAAVAAPLITKGPAAPVAVAAPVNWTGFYVGGFFGAGFGTSTMTFLGDGNTRPRLGGPVGGGQVGYNWQVGPYVLGVEGDAGAAHIHGARTCGGDTGINANGLGGGFSPFFLTCSTDLEWTGTLGARLGVTWDRALFYVKAGAAFTRENVAIGCIYGPNNGNPFNARNCYNQAGVTLPNTVFATPPFGTPAVLGLTNGSTASDDRFGLMAGWGTEFALDANWSAKGEFVYMNFGSDTVRTTDGTVLKVDTHVSEVKVGLNYRFNPSMR